MVHVGWRTRVDDRFDLFEPSSLRGYPGATRYGTDSWHEPYCTPCRPARASQDGSSASPHFFCAGASMLKAKQIRALSHGMAAALLAGDWSAEPMNARLADALGRRWRWRRTVVRHLLVQHATPPSYEILADAIASDSAAVQIAGTN